MVAISAVLGSLFPDQGPAGALCSSNSAGENQEEQGCPVLTEHGWAHTRGWEPVLGPIFRM